jgi:hypothetical protein
MNSPAASPARRALLMGLQFGVAILLIPVSFKVPGGSEAVMVAFIAGAGALSGWRLQRGRGPIISFAIAYAMGAMPLALPLIGFQGLGSTPPTVGEIASYAGIYGLIWGFIGLIGSATLAPNVGAVVSGGLGYAIGGAIGGALIRAFVGGDGMAGLVILPPMLGGIALGWTTATAPSPPP